jgi:predicted DNA-binding ribbon-helix-helix protein
MSVLTIRIPQSKHERLKNLAKARGVSVNKLMEELSTIALVQHDAEVRFRALAARGSRKTGLALLDKLDRSFARSRQTRA